MDSEPKVALVTGSSSGIGAATVKLLSSLGYRVVIVGSRKEKVDRIAKECQDISPGKFEPLTLVLDFSFPENGEVAVKKTIEHFRRLDVLINNAGIYDSSPPDMYSYDLYRQVMTVNIDATVRTTLTAVDYLKKTKGSLIFVSSVASVVAAGKGYAYCMSKSAMSMFSKCMAIDLAPDVRVNTVSPGPVQTSIWERVGLTPDLVETLLDTTTLLNRVGRSEEVAEVIAFLISDKASFIGGHELIVDGGYMLKPAAEDVARRLNPKEE